MPRRRFPTLVLTLVLAATAMPSAAAQSEEEVREARLAADRAAEARRTLETSLGSATGDLFDAIDRYQRLTTELTDASLSLVALEEEVRNGEQALREGRAAVRKAVIDAYAVASSGDLGPVLDVPSLEDVAIVTDLLARSAAAGEHSLAGYEAERRRLEARRAELEAMRADAAVLRRKADSMVAALDALVADLSVATLEARSAEVAAESALELARAELEAAKNSVSPRAYAWRHLVERYFPPELLWEALQVLDCESRGDPDATNPTSGAAGLFQFLEGTWVVASAFAGFEGASPYEPEANVAAAAWLVRHSVLIDHPRGTWGHWACQPR